MAKAAAHKPFPRLRVWSLPFPCRSVSGKRPQSPPLAEPLTLRPSHCLGSPAPPSCLCYQAAAGSPLTPHVPPALYRDQRADTFHCGPAGGFGLVCIKPELGVSVRKWGVGGTSHKDVASWLLLKGQKPW